MARLWSSGAELNSTTLEGAVESGNTHPTISISVVHSGVYAYKHDFVSTFSSLMIYTFSSGIKKVYARIYFYVTANPPAQCYLLDIIGNSGLASILLQTDGTLQLHEEKSFTQVGNASSAISLNAWNYIELFVDTTTITSSILTARLNGSQFATGTFNLTNQGDAQKLEWGPSLYASGTYTVYTDDIAINDSTGSFQNSYPGEGKIIHLRPNAAGDSTQWTPDSGSNYARVNEVTPDDATSLVADSVLNDSDLYNCDDSGIGASDTVNVVQVGVRFRNDVADATTNFKVQIEKASGGTISQSSAITPNSTTWKTNATAVPNNYPLTLYQDPDSSNWTQSTLDSMQIGVQSSLIGVNKNQVSTIWALVDYTPSAGGTPLNVDTTGYASGIQIRS